VSFDVLSTVLHVPQPLCSVLNRRRGVKRFQFSRYLGFAKIMKNEPQKREERALLFREQKNESENCTLGARSNQFLARRMTSSRVVRASIRCGWDLAEFVDDI
jgi:hypothetical protein